MALEVMISEYLLDELINQSIQRPASALVVTSSYLYR